MKVAIIGAYDRFNYGDMLFPYIIEHFMNTEFKNEQNEFTCFALRESDYSIYNAKKTRPLHQLYRNHEDYDLVVVSGGDTIPASLYGLYLDNCDSAYDFYKSIIIKKILGKDKNLKYLENKTGISYEYPYNIDLNNVVYNSVGGSGLKDIKGESKDIVMRILEKSKYLGVRDKYSYQQVKHMRANLQPDSAMILSDIWDLNYLKRNSSQNIKRIVSDFGQYITIQIKSGITKSNFKYICKFIEDVYQKWNIKTILLPIGRVYSHGDINSLKKIAKKCKNYTILLDDLSLQEIAYIIANGNYFVGTSLHGNITASTYLVPSSLIADVNTKNWAYHDTWFKNTYCILSRFDSLLDDVSVNIKCDKEISEIYLSEQKKLVYKHFRNMASSILNSEDEKQKGKVAT